jgi:hypothetical protein
VNSLAAIEEPRMMRISSQAKRSTEEPALFIRRKFAPKRLDRDSPSYFAFFLTYSLRAQRRVALAAAASAVSLSTKFSPFALALRVG